MARGIIANAIKHYKTDLGSHITDQISPEDVRSFLLYWDKIIIPANNAIYVGVPDEDILIEQGYIERPMSKIDYATFDLSMIDACLQSQLAVAKQYQENDKKTDWVMHQFSEQLNLADSEIHKNRSLRLSLAKLLPVPTKDASITDVIEFKERRKGLFNAFHEKMDHVYLEALKCPDQSLGFYNARKELEEILLELERLSSEKWSLLKRISWSSTFNLDLEKLAGISGIVYAAYSSSTTPEMAAIIATVGGVVSINAQRTSVAEWNRNNPILAYLSNAAKEGLIKP